MSNLTLKEERIAFGIAVVIRLGIMTVITMAALKYLGAC